MAEAVFKDQERNSDQQEGYYIWYKKSPAAVLIGNVGEASDVAQSYGRTYHHEQKTESALPVGSCVCIHIL